MHKSDLGLTPKAAGSAFRQPVYFGGGDAERNTYYGDGSTYGESETNTVIKHQRNSVKNESSGVSTTPVFENAKRYALHVDSVGYVYQIDTQLLQEHGVSAYEVAEHAAKPAFPHDQEVILVASDLGTLPKAIVVKVEAITASE
jgi:hypothetical protein